MCNKNNYNDIFKQIAEYRTIKKQAEEVLKDLEGQVKDYMSAEGITELIGLEHIAKYQEVTSNRLDTKALKFDLPEVYDKYNRESISNRFNFS